jgi:hypothetical protein
MNGCGIQIFVSTAKVAVCFSGLVVLFSQVLQNIYCVCVGGVSQFGAFVFAGLVFCWCFISLVFVLFIGEVGCFLLGRSFLSCSGSCCLLYSS